MSRAVTESCSLPTSQESSSVGVTDYLVNTITLTAKSGLGNINIDLLKKDHEYAAVDFQAVEGRPFVSHFSYRDGKEIVRTGKVLKRNGKVRNFSNRMFDNQATVVVRMPYNGGYDLNIKVFRNGNLQMTGARSVDHGKEAANIALGSMGGNVHDVQIRLMNCNFYVSKRINREAMHIVAKDLYGMQSSFNPSIYPAVKIYYMMNQHDDGKCHANPQCTGFGPNACCKRVTLLVFSGKPNKIISSAIITGAVNKHQIDAVHSWFTNVVKKHTDTLFYM